MSDSGIVQAAPAAVCPAGTAADRIRWWDRRARTAAREAVEAAVMCGRELAGVKSRLGHGNFEAWIADNCDFGARTARRYMQLAERSAGEIGPSKSDTVSDLGPSNSPAAAPAPAPADGIEGRTLTRLYEDYGVVRRPAEWGGRRAGAGRRPAEPVSIAAEAAQIAADPVLADAEALRLIESLWRWAIAGGGVSRMTRSALGHIIGRCTEIADAAGDALRPKWRG